RGGGGGGGVPAVDAGRRVAGAVVVVADPDVVAGLDHLVHTADVVAVLVPGDGVVDARRGRKADRLQVGDDLAGPLAGVAGFEQHGGAVRSLDQDRAAPADVDVVDLQLLRRDAGRHQQTNEQSALPHRRPPRRRSSRASPQVYTTSIGSSAGHAVTAVTET